MISCQLIHVTRNPQGLPINKESTLSAEEIQIGRGAACKIHLMDHRVGLLHASIKRSEDGTLYIEAEKDATIEINGYIEQNAALSPGTRVEIGPYELSVESAVEGHDICLSVELVHPLPEIGVAQAARRPAFTLAALGVSKRKLGIYASLFIFLVFLLLPLLPGLSSEFDRWQAGQPITLNEVWNPGEISHAHSVFGVQCSSCHQQAFKAVADNVCVGCHKQYSINRVNHELHANELKQLRCIDCHPDHKGAQGLVLHDQPGCVACHGEIKAKKGTTELADVKDFGTSHPVFRIALLEDKKYVRIRQNEPAKLQEKSGLKYSHAVHLAKEGVSSPQGDVVMVCQDCHKIDEAGAHFKPMTMQKTCQQSRCHELYFQEPVEGDVPHGSERAVMQVLRSYYMNQLVNSSDKEACAQADKTGNSLKQALNCADMLARNSAASSLFRSEQDCGECHEISSSNDSEVPWKVAPVRINRDWQPAAMFSHAKHETMNCVDCHDKMYSKNSADISMPTIEKCRECHVGERKVKGKISTGCDTCHLFHQHRIEAGH